MTKNNKQSIIDVAKLGIALGIASLLGEGCTSTPTIPSGELKTKVYNQYILRGMNFGTEPVDQTTATITLGNVSASGFANYDSDAKKINEIDGWAEIGKDTSLGYGYVGWQHLHFPNQPFPDTEETYGGLATHFTGTPSVFIAHDEKLGSGTYWEGSVEANKEWKNGTNLKLKLIGAYNDDYYLEGSAPSHVGATATITLPASKNCSLEASIESIEGLREDVDSTTTLSTGVKWKW